MNNQWDATDLFVGQRQYKFNWTMLCLVLISTLIWSVFALDTIQPLTKYHFWYFLPNPRICSERRSLEYVGKKSERASEVGGYRQPSSCMNFYPLIDWNEIMTAFPAAKLPLHPPEDANTLWASPANKERRADGGGGMQNRRGRGKTGRLVKRRSEEIKLSREKMGCTHTYGMI